MRHQPKPPRGHLPAPNWQPRRWGEIPPVYTCRLPGGESWENAKVDGAWTELDAIMPASKFREEGVWKEKKYVEWVCRGEGQVIQLGIPGCTFVRHNETGAWYVELVMLYGLYAPGKPGYGILSAILEAVKDDEEGQWLEREMRMQHSPSQFAVPAYFPRGNMAFWAIRDPMRLFKGSACLLSKIPVAKAADMRTVHIMPMNPDVAAANYAIACGKRRVGNTSDMFYGPFAR